MSERKESYKDNLVSLAEYSPERRSEIARMGAEASNKKQKQKRLLKEYLQAALELEDDEGVDKYTKITRALIDKAEDGDTKAYEVVRDTLGQKPVDKLNMNANLSYEEKIKEVTDSDEY